MAFSFFGRREANRTIPDADALRGHGRARRGHAARRDLVAQLLEAKAGRGDGGGALVPGVGRAGESRGVLLVRKSALPDLPWG